MNFIIRRILFSIITVFTVAVIVFVALRVIPGNPVAVVVGPTAPPSVIKQATDQLGLNLPIYDQFFIWMKGFFTFNLGRSYISNQEVTVLLTQATDRSVLLIAFGMTFSVGLAMTTGIISAAYSEKKVLDGFLNSIASILNATPTFWLGFILIYLFSVRLHWLPSAGIGGVSHLILPALTYTLFTLPAIHRTLRAGLLEELEKPYCVAAKAKGASKFRVIMKHALKNAMTPVVTIIGVQFGHVFGASVIVETVFSWPGLGLLITNSILADDYLVAQDGVVLLSIIVILSNLVADLIVLRLNRRVRF